MKRINRTRTRYLKVRLSEEEEKRLNILHKRAKSQELGEYARCVLLKEPVHIIFRNQSADDFLSEMVQIKNELNCIDNNFSLMVKKLHSLEFIPEFKSCELLKNPSKEAFQNKVEAILGKVNQIYAQWLQK
ncbi:MAG: hypothetical protein NVS9B7_28410 [Flavisolibacter sp.]